MIERVAILAGALLVFGLSLNVARAADEKRGEIGFLWGVAVADEDVTGEATEDFTFGLRGGCDLDSHWTWFGEGLFSRFDSTTPAVDPASVVFPILVPSDDGVETLSVRTGLQYLFTRDRKRNWFLSFGPGWMDVSRSDLRLTDDGMGGISEERVSGDFDRFLVSLGGGQRFSVNPILRVHWEVRVDQTFTLKSASQDEDGVGGRGVAQGHVLIGVGWGLGAR